MANNSSAEGTMQLKGRWTKQAIEQFLPVLRVWRAFGEYGIQQCDTPSYQQRKVSFSGCGRWTFSSTLEEFDAWTRSWLHKEAGQETVLLTEETYDTFLQVMEEKNLKIVFDFQDRESGVGMNNHVEGFFTSEAGMLAFHQTKCEAILFSEEGRDYGVDFFAQFLQQPDREAISVWMEDHISFSDVFSHWSLDEYSQIIYELDEMGEDDPFPSFCRKFFPDTKAWEAFCEEYEEIKGYNPEDGE